MRVQVSSCNARASAHRSLRTAAIEVAKRLKANDEEVSVWTHAKGVFNSIPLSEVSNHLPSPRPRGSVRLA